MLCSHVVMLCSCNWNVDVFVCHAADQVPLSLLQYAHKLAAMVGQVMHAHHDERIADRLFYL